MLTTVNKRVWNKVGYTCHCLGTLTISITYNSQIYLEAAIFYVCILLLNILSRYYSTWTSYVSITIFHFGEVN